MAETMKHGQPIRELYPLKGNLLMYFLLPSMRVLWPYFKIVNVWALVNIILAYSPWENISNLIWSFWVVLQFKNGLKLGICKIFKPDCKITIYSMIITHTQKSTHTHAHTQILSQRCWTNHTASTYTCNMCTYVHVLVHVCIANYSNEG